MILHNNGKCLQDIESMPISHMNWAIMWNNQLIANQLNYNAQELDAAVTAGVATLNDGQRHVFDRVSESCKVREVGAFFVHIQEDVARLMSAI